MLGQVTKVLEKEVQFEGYIRGNMLNVKRLVHITGVRP